MTHTRWFSQTAIMGRKSILANHFTGIAEQPIINCNWTPWQKKNLAAWVKSCYSGQKIDSVFSQNLRGVFFHPDNLNEKAAAKMKRKPQANQHPLMFALLFCTGFVSLALEICWIKKGALIFGATSYALSTVVAVFFGGMALGSYLLGKWVSKSTLSPTRLLGITQIVLAVLILINPLLFVFFQWLFKSSYPYIYTHPILLTLCRFLILTLLLAPAATLMGGVYPIFAHGFVSLKNKPVFSLGFLYGINTMGAVFGCLVCGFLFLRFWGINPTILFLGGLTALLGAVFLFLKTDLPGSKHLLSNPRPDPNTMKKERTSTNGSSQAVMLMICFFCIGFSSLAFEILWTRFLSLLVSNTVYSVTLSLAATLFGIVIGAGLIARLGDKLSNTTLILAGAQGLLGISTLVIMLLPPEAWARIQSTSLLKSASFLNSTILTALVIFVIPSIFSGICFPLAIRLVLSQSSHIGLQVGKMTALNTTGGILGSLVMGFILLPFLGLQLSLYIAAGLCLLISIAIVWGISSQLFKSIKTVLTAGLVMVMFFVPKIFTTKIPEAHLVEAQKKVKLVEGVSANLTVVEDKQETTLKIDGLWQGSNKQTHQVMAAHIPMMLHANPKNICVIGLGTGQTAKRFLMYNIRSLDVVDIEQELPNILDHHFEGDWMSDPRFRFIGEDGRNYLFNTPLKYDVVSIEVGQVFRPQCASFYTADFYQSILQSLSKNGIVTQFLPIILFSKEQLKTAIRTFLSVFPHASLWYNRGEFILAGSVDSPLVLFQKRLALLAENKRVNSDLAFGYWGGKDHHLNHPGVFTGGFLADTDQLAAMVDGDELFSDNVLTLEYETFMQSNVDMDKLEGMLQLVTDHLSSPSDLLKKQFSNEVIRGIKQVQRLNIGNILSSGYVEKYHITHQLEYLKQAMTHNPYNLEAMILFSVILMEDRKYEQAVSILNRVLQMDSSQSAAHNNLGLIWAKHNKHDYAVESYQKALSIDTDNANILNNLGISFSHLGQYRPAKQAFKRAIALDPQLKKAQRNLKLLIQNTE